MGKLSKREISKQVELKELIDSGNLTEDQVEHIYQEFNEGFIGDVTHSSAYFTPLDLAFDFSLMSPTHGVLLDACAGNGVLSYTAKIRDTHHNNIKQQICIEKNPEFVTIGEKLVPEADWYCGSIFDQQLHQKIFKKHGIKQYDSMLSNPPFGTVTMKYVADGERDWLGYTGKEFDMAVIEVGFKLAESHSYILPQQSCTFQVSGVSYHQHKENRKFNKLKKDINAPHLIQLWSSIDTTCYDGFKNTKALVECLTVENDIPIELKDHSSNCLMFDE